MIKSIKWNNHEILGDLELNFTKPNGEAYNTIILAGENGSGKTTILETLATFLNLGSVEYFKEIVYDIKEQTYLITPDENGANFGFHKRRKESDGIEVTIRTNRNNNFKQIESDFEDIRHYGCSYSKARSGFSTKKVTSTTTQQLDESKYMDDSQEDYTTIKQLIVDIDSQDNSEWMEICKSGMSLPFEDFLRTSRLYRFRQAFDDFFDALKFKKIDPSYAEEKLIVFEKHGNQISLDNLSTGEKQIVFRGSYLLKNSGNFENGVVLIDEPELSMHPKWQKRILKYYRDLFTASGVQFAQIILSTHSEYVIHAALEDNDNVLVVILKDDNGSIISSRTSERVFPTLMASEINYLAFGIASIDYHIALYGRLQSVTQKHRIVECDAFISQHPNYNATLHEKIDCSQYGSFRTLPTYIRNAIDRPDSGREYSSEELQRSIDLLRQLCYPYRNS